MAEKRAQAPSELSDTSEESKDTEIMGHKEFDESEQDQYLVDSKQVDLMILSTPTVSDEHVARISMQKEFVKNSRGKIALKKEIKRKN